MINGLGWHFMQPLSFQGRFLQYLWFESSFVLPFSLIARLFPASRIYSSLDIAVLWLRLPRSDPSHAKDDQPHDNPCRPDTCAAQSKEWSNKQSDMDDSRDNQEDVEMPPPLLHVSNTNHISGQTKEVRHTTLIPSTFRCPLASPIFARHHAMKRNPRTARIEPTIKFTILAPQTSLIIAMMEMAVRIPRIAIMQIRRASTATRLMNS